MAVVDEFEQRRRASGLGAFMTIALLTALLATPILGQITALILSGVMAIKAWVKSANRLADIGIALGGLAGYYAVLGAVVFLSEPKSGASGMVLACGAFGLAWVWLFHARVGFES